MLFKTRNVVPVFSHKTSTVLLCSSAIVVFLLALYGSVASSRLTAANHGGDGGDLLAAILLYGVPHPTGYPIYLLIGELFQKVPLGSPYLKGTLVSIFAAAFCGRPGLPGNCLAQVPVYQDDCPGGCGHRPVARDGVHFLVPGGHCRSVRPAGVFRSLRRDVVADHPLRRYSRKKDAVLSLLACLAGLGLGNHLTIILIIPAFLFALLVAKRAGFPAKCLARYLILSGLGLVSYLYLPFLARNYPTIDWGNPQDVQGLAWLVSGSYTVGHFFTSRRPIHPACGGVLGLFIAGFWHPGAVCRNCRGGTQFFMETTAPGGVCLGLFVCCCLFDWICDQ